MKDEEREREIGPKLHTMAPAFETVNAQGNVCQLQDFLNKQGLLLAFVCHIWEPSTIRRILHMQRHFSRFQREGYNVALVIQDKEYALWTFHMSSPMSVQVPLLADENGCIHQSFNMKIPGLLLLNETGIVTRKWLIPDERLWPRARDLLETVSTS